MQAPEPRPVGAVRRGHVRLLTEDDRRFAVVFVDDQSEHARMEATRRDFVANVSHELKTPVGAMGVLAEALLASTDDPETVSRFAEMMITESNRLANMVGELIELSRLQGAEPLPDLEAVDVDSVVGEALSRYKVAADNADIAITTDAPTGFRVLGDQPLLVTAIANLVSNAIAYSPKGSPVSISRRSRGDNIEIAVTDRGIGIARDDQERVFERFFRVDTARSRATGGTGLGLAIVKHVAANHNGSIRLWSQPGTGSTFTLSIPAHPETDDESDEREDQTQPMTSVLIVEDEESLADPLAFLLRKEGFEATVVTDGPSALAEFERSGADIVLLDLMLPGMSGTDVCKQLRSRSSVPVIMVTARDSEIDKVVGLELGADDYVTKPYSARELIARIRAVLRRGVDNDDSGIGDGVLEAGPVRMDVERHIVSVNGDADHVAAQGVRPARVPDAQQRPGAHPRSVDRPGVGRRLRRRHQDARRARQAAALEDRGRPGQPGPPGDGARPGLQARGLTRRRSGHCAARVAGWIAMSPKTLRRLHIAASSA